MIEKLLNTITLQNIHVEIRNEKYTENIVVGLIGICRRMQ